MAQTHDNNKNMNTSWQNTTLDDSFDYSDSFSQTFLSPMSTTLQDMDDLDYSSTTTTAPTSITGKKKLVQALPVFEESIPDYSSSTSSMLHYVGPMDIHHQRPQRHSMLASGSKQYNVFINQPIQQFHQHQQQPSPTSSSNLMNGFTSFSPPNSTSSNNFPMSAPANIGYEFNLNTSHHNGSPTATTIHTASPTSTLSMNLPTQQPPTDLSSNIEDDYAMQINLQAMMEKRRRRRESHNAVERRRRENINERIQELGTLLPQSMLDEITNGGSGPHSPSTSTGHPSSSGTTTTIAGGNNITGKPNKGAILRKSVDHIKLLQQELKTYQQRVKELESTLARYNHHSK